VGSNNWTTAGKEVHLPSGFLPILCDPKGVNTIDDYLDGFDALERYGFHVDIGELDCRGVFLDMDSNFLLKA